MTELASEFFPHAAAATPLLIIHGFFASARNWRGIAKALAADRPVYVLDMRNHGVSPHAPEMDYPLMAADVAAFMDRHGIARADLLGHSMGGKIAMWLALQQPARIGRLIVADIAPVDYRHSFDATVQALLDLPLAEFGNRKQMEEWLAPAIPDLAYRQFLLQNLQFADGIYSWRINLQYFRHNAAHIVGFPRTAPDHAYSRPALFLAGGDSRYVDPAAVRRLFPNAQLATMPGCGHWLHVEDPQTFLRLVGAWLSAG